MMATRTKQGMKPLTRAMFGKKPKKLKPYSKQRLRQKVAVDQRLKAEAQKRKTLLEQQQRAKYARYVRAQKVGHRHKVKFTRQQTIGYGRASGQIKRQREMPSSNILHGAYDSTTKILVVDFNRGVRYRFKDVEYDDAMAFLNARGTCKTTGKNQWGMWWKGKNPSLGAAFWQHIRNKYFDYEIVSTASGQIPMRASSKPLISSTQNDAQNWRYP